VAGPSQALVAEVLRVATAYVSPRVDAAPGGPAKLRAYIEAHTALLADHPNHLPALVEIVINLPRDHTDRAELLARLEARNSVHTTYIRQAQAVGANSRRRSNGRPGAPDVSATDEKRPSHGAIAAREPSRLARQPG